MLKINGYEENYKQLFIYNDKGEILYKTERPYELNLDIKVNVRNARKLMFNKKDCFEIKTSYKGYFLDNGKDLYIHNSIIDVVRLEEKKCLQCHGETNYKDIYTLKLNYLDGTEVKVESDYYTRTEKTDERIYREKLADIITEYMYTENSISHYEVERLLERLDITIKD